MSMMRQANPEPPCPSCRQGIPGGLEECPNCGLDLAAAGRERAARRFRRAKLLLTALLIVGFLLNLLGDDLVGWLGGAKKGPVALSLRLSGTALLVAGGIFYARLKGRSGWWGLIGLLNCIGYFVLLYLDKICLHCGARSKDKGEECPHCRAPI